MTEQSQEKTGKPIVLKFGGTSVKDAQAMRRVVAIVERERGNHPVVVTSACAGVTDLLLATAQSCGAGDLHGALQRVHQLRQRHLEILHDLGLPAEHSCQTVLTRLLDEVEQLARGVVLLGELTPRTLDAFASYGERLSSQLLGDAFRAAGWHTAVADSRQFIITDANFVNARPLMPQIDAAVAKRLVPLVQGHDVVVAQGVVGATLDGVTTTIGRGGSDHTGALVGAALHATEIQIWTDVSGILTADPRAVPQAQVVPHVTFTEARELAWFGAKVIHPDTIVPAVERAIPVVIKNSIRPDDAGTRILPDGSPISPGIHSITMKRGMLSVMVGPRDPRATSLGFQKALGVFAAHGLPIQCAAIAEARGIITVEAAGFNDLILAGLEANYVVELMPEMAVICMIGAGLRGQPGALSRPLAALGEIPIGFVVAGSSDHIILLGVADHHAAEALQKTHHMLFEQSRNK
ncbi:MAG: aspartate kinase [Chlorobi bacterium CHB2]|nr:aspartate kinase [Chlorobi bacterium CHB2]